MRLAKLLAFAATALVGACNPYDPDLGPTPFLCAPTEPRCPDGYGAVEDNGRCVCTAGAENQAPDGAIDPPDGGVDGGGDCPSEAVTGDPNGNETPQTATYTPIGNGTSTAVFNDLSICPATDRDVFSMNITQSGKKIEVRAQYDESKGKLQVRILDAQGASVGVADSGTNLVRATYTATTPGMYYGEISAGAAGVTNIYDVTMVVSGP